MPFDWNDYLTLAEELATRADDASMRTAISRAYYCVFNLAFTRAERTVGPKPWKEPSHSWCWKIYESTPDVSCKQVGIDGDRMKRTRVKADYEAADIPRLDDKVRRTLEDARQFRRALEALDPRYPHP